MTLATLLAILLLIFLSRCIAKMKGELVPWQMDPVVLFSAPWTIALVVFALPLYEYRESLEQQHFVYIVLAHSVFAISTWCFGWRASMLRQVHFQNHFAQLAPKPVFILCLISLGLLGAAAVFYDALSTGSVSLASRISGEGLAQARSEGFAASMQSIGGPLMFLERFVVAGVLGVVMLILSSRNGQGDYRRIFRLLSIVMLIAIAINSIVIKAGRMEIVLFIFLIFGALALDPDRTAPQLWNRIGALKKKAIILMASMLLIIATGYLATGFVSNRSAGASPLNSLYVHHRMQLTPIAMDMVGENKVLEYAFLSLSYVTAPISTLIYYLDLSDSKMTGPYWGQYNFEGPTRFLMRRIGLEREQTEFWSIRYAVWTPLAMQGYGQNVWATALRDFAIDFGWGWAVIFLGFLGGFSKYLMLRAYKLREPDVTVGALAIGVLLVFSIAHSLFHIQIISGLIYWSIFVFFARKFMPRLFFG